MRTSTGKMLTLACAALLQERRRVRLIDAILWFTVCAAFALAFIG